MFVSTLICGWVKARQSAAADPAVTAGQLLAWMDDDPFSFCFGLEKDMGSVLSTAGLAALVKQVRSRFDAQAPQDEGSPHRAERYTGRRYGEMLRVLYIVQKDVEAYVGLAGVTGR